MKLNRIITVLLLGSLCFSGQQATVTAHAAVADTVISNQLTPENDTKEMAASQLQVTTSEAVTVDSVQVAAEQGETAVGNASVVDATAEEIGIVEEADNRSTEEKIIADAQVQKEKLSQNKTSSTKKAPVAKKYSKAELKLMSCIIYAEASGEPYAGKLAVGIVVMNRKSSKSFPNTVKGVIYQKYQFGPVRNGSLNRALKRYEAGNFNSSSEKACIKAAKAALSGEKKVTYRSKTYNMKSYHFFSTRVHKARLIIQHHQFK